MPLDSTELRTFVDKDKGLVSPEIFVSQEIFEAELEQVFGRSWLFLAHDTMIENPGDFYSTYMGGDPVIVARQRDGSVKAFLNICRHRGMRVCRAESGNAKAFMCTYHGWTYDGAGALINVPNANDAYYGELDKSQWGLLQIRVESYKGLYFGNFDATAPSLINYLGDMTFYLDTWLDGADGGLEVLPGVIKWTVDANWKFASEQFAGDGYHAQISHLSSFPVLNPNYQQNWIAPGRQFSSPEGHAHSFMLLPGRPMQDSPIGRYQHEHQQRRIERLGEEAGHMTGNFNVFPNFAGLTGLVDLGAVAAIRVVHPKGPNKFEIWSYAMVERNAPADIKKTQARMAGLTSGPAGMIETDDGENWSLIGQMLTSSPQGRKLAFNYQMGVGHEREDDPTFPGIIGSHYFGEGPQRHFYGRWLDFMTSGDWPVIKESQTAELGARR
ncbi:MAG: aromatic ring-hydroxylating dioxygenase subunit alpha [Actinomycetota bacterium]|nr:aromatic ring-hydroxylating dioxygenase subunit alpha [Actinomycetota bacterium]